MADRSALEYDSGLLTICLCLMGVGLINLLSASSSVDGQGVLWNFGHPSAVFKSQLTYMFLGLGIIFGLSRIDYRVFERMAYPIYVLSLGFLILVLFLGETRSGSTRWMELGGMRFQPSEPGKLSLILVLAKFLHSKRKRQAYGLTELWAPFLLILLPLALLYKEPDLGTGLFYAAVGFTMILFAGVKPKPLILLGIVAVIGGIFAYKFMLRPYQQDRILMFFNPQMDPLGRGYHVIQSLIAVGSGRFFGKGYLAGSQSQLKFLPEQHTDFIFSVLAEEWGFVGGLVLVILYFALLTRGLTIASRARDGFGAFLGIGLTALFFWQMVVNMGAVLGLLPITGITLPFLSYGGSSLLTLCIAVGLLQSIAIRRFSF